MLGLAAHATLRSASNAGAGSAGDAALDRRIPGETAAELQHEEQRHPAGVGSRHHRLSL